MTLDNPEAAWTRAAVRSIDRAEIERRIGPVDEPFQVLAGGLANVNVRIGDARVLRIARDPSTLGKEVTLLERPWRSLRVPAVLAAGDDFLVLEHLSLAPLPATAGALVGRALAEIHATTYAQTGFLASDLSLATPHDFSVAGYGQWNLAEAERFLDAALAARVRAFFDAIAGDGARALGTPVLSHCDFKLSNLHLTTAGELVVLDWEFAWAGPRLLDVGLLLRWQPPEPFVRAFADAYRAAGGVLVDDWRRIATAIDLGSLLGLYAKNPIARTTDDIPRRIAAIV